MTHKGTCPIQTERLFLRKIIPEDAAMVYAWMSDPQVCKYERWAPHPNVDYSRGYIMEVFGDYESDHMYQWGIQLGDRLIGSVSIVNVSDGDRKAVLGYCLARTFWGQGYATEAVKAVLRFMFETVGINRIEASHAVLNAASGRVLEKAGMRLEGCAKEYYISNDGVQDSRLFGLTRSQYMSLPKAPAP